MSRTAVRNLTMSALLAALTAVCAQIVVPLPFTPVFFSLAVLAVLLCGALLPPRWAAGAQLCYLLLGAAGLPVFGGFGAGPGVLAGPTGGYLLSYPLMALAAALLVRAGWKSFPRRAAACALALAPCHLLGAVWLSLSTGMTPQAAFLAGSAPFLLPDLLKATLSAYLSQQVERALSRP